MTPLPQPKAQGQQAESSALGILRRELVASFLCLGRSWPGTSSLRGGERRCCSPTETLQEPLQTRSDKELTAGTCRLIKLPSVGFADFEQDSGISLCHSPVGTEQACFI